MEPKKDSSALSETTQKYGIKVFGTKEQFEAWLNDYCISLAARPIDCSEKEIMTTLGQSEHGVYS